MTTWTYGTNTVCGPGPLGAPEIRDRESAPSAQDMAPIPGQYPRGPAWRTDEVADASKPGTMGQVWTALGGYFAGLYAAAWSNHVQVFPSLLDVSLADWEAEYGLPDCCVSPTEEFAQRKAAVRLRYADQGGCSPAYFICLAAAAGYSIDIEEPTNFECGYSECGSLDYAASSLPLGFELGRSQCGLDDYASNIELDDYWIIHVHGYPFTNFECGAGELGVTRLTDFSIAVRQVTNFETGVAQVGIDRLTDISGAPALECLILRRAPKFTIPIFVYEA